MRGVTFKIARVLSIRSRHVLYEFKQGRYLPCFFMVNNGLFLAYRMTQIMTLFAVEKDLWYNGKACDSDTIPILESLRYIKCPT